MLNFSIFKQDEALSLKTLDNDLLEHKPTTKVKGTISCIHLIEY